LSIEQTNFIDVKSFSSAIVTSEISRLYCLRWLHAKKNKQTSCMSIMADGTSQQKSPVTNPFKIKGVVRIAKNKETPKGQ